MLLLYEDSSENKCYTTCVNKCMRNMINNDMIKFTRVPKIRILIEVVEEEEDEEKILKKKAKSGK